MPDFHAKSPGAVLRRDPKTRLQTAQKAWTDQKLNHFNRSIQSCRLVIPIFHYCNNNGGIEVRPPKTHSNCKLCRNCLSKPLKYSLHYPIELYIIVTVIALNSSDTERGAAKVEHCGIPIIFVIFHKSAGRK
jgi:hypothetical protein